jgi:hypothetical protein
VRQRNWHGRRSDLLAKSRLTSGRHLGYFVALDPNYDQSLRLLLDAIGNDSVERLKLDGAAISDEVEDDHPYVVHWSRPSSENANASGRIRWRRDSRSS